MVDTTETADKAWIEEVTLTEDGGLVKRLFKHGE